MLAVVLATLAKLVVILKLGLRSMSKSWRSYINFQDWIKKKKAAINPQNEDVNVFNTQQLFHQIMTTLSGIQKEFQTLNHL